MFFHVRSNLRHWMLLPAAFLLLVSLPIFANIAYAIWTDDLGRLLLGALVLTGYCLVAAVIVKLGIAIDEQMLRHERLRPDARGNYERPLERQPEPGVQVEMTLVRGTAYTGCTTEYGSPRGEPLSQEQGYAAQR